MNVIFLISESQERMLLVCRHENKQGIKDVLKKWDLEASTIGTVNLKGTYNVYGRSKQLILSEKGG